MSFIRKTKLANGKRQITVAGVFKFSYQSGSFRLLKKEKLAHGKRRLYLFGIPVYSYTSAFMKRLSPNFTLQDKLDIIRTQFKKSLGRDLNIEEPRTFNDKLQWLKLYHHDPLIPACGDKVRAREVVTRAIGAEYLVPALGVWDKPEDIPFDSLPDQFVLKVNWGSGQNIIVRDKSTLDIAATRARLAEWMQPQACHYYYSFEPSYHGYAPRILCEEYVGELADNLTCYKIFNFGRKPYLIQAVFDDKTKYETINYYDTAWNLLDLRQNYPNNPNKMPAPRNLKKMLELAEKLAQPFEHFVRTDFYEIGDRVLFSEFTFYSDNGMAAFHPEEWDVKLGELITLPVAGQGEA